MRELDTMDRVRKILSAAGIDDYGDGIIVTDVVQGYAEPGYGTFGSDDDVIVFGQWNNARSQYDAEKDGTPLTKAERLASRLGDALEHAGAEVEWLDEWATCGECYRAVRTQADSYSWKPSYAWVNDCEITCADCMLKDLASYVDEYVNDPDRAITWADASDMVAAGWTRHEPEDDNSIGAGTYNSGWHEGMNADPAKILELIHAESGDDVDVVFLLDESSQFYVGFSAWTRDEEDDS